MVQPTDKSVIGSDLREHSIKKREFADFDNNYALKEPSPRVVLAPRSSGSTWTRSAFTAFLCLFFVRLSLLFFALQRQSVFRSVLRRKASARHRKPSVAFSK